MGAPPLLQKIRKNGRMGAPRERKSPSAHRAERQKAAHKTRAAEKTAAGLHTAPDRNAVCRNTAARQNPPVGAAARPNRRRPGDGAAGRSSGFGARPLTAAAPRGNHTRLPYSPCGKTRQGTWRSFAEQKRFTRNGLIIKPIKKRKASANAFSSVRQNPSLVNEKRSA